MKTSNHLEGILSGIPDLCEELKEMTENNCHGEARLTIAEYFGMDYHYQMFEAINALHAQDHHLNTDMRDARFAVTHDMFTRLENDYSLETLQPIKDSL